MKHTKSRYKQENKSPQYQIREDISRHPEYPEAKQAADVLTSRLEPGESAQVRRRQSGFAVVKRRPIKAT